MALRPEILRRQKDFDRLYKKGRSVGEKYIVLFYVDNGLPYNRKAFLASKKVGGAVIRNRARRLMKESFRRVENILPPGKDVLLIARKTITDASCDSVEQSLRRALRKGRLIQ